MRHDYMALVVLAMAAEVVFKLQNLASVTVNFLTST